MWQRPSGHERVRERPGEQSNRDPSYESNILYHGLSRPSSRRQNAQSNFSATTHSSESLKPKVQSLTIPVTNPHMSQTFFYHETSIPSRGSPLLCPTRSLTVQLQSKSKVSRTPTQQLSRTLICHKPSFVTNPLYPPEAHKSFDEYTIGLQWRRLPTKRAYSSLKVQSKPRKPVTAVLINQGR